VGDDHADRAGGRPILGGILCDSVGWQWIFFIKVPVAALGALRCSCCCAGRPHEKAGIDKVGLGLLVLWVARCRSCSTRGAMPTGLPRRNPLAGRGGAGGLSAFVIWEITEKEPIVDLRIFRHRGFTAAALTYAVGLAPFSPAS
jgi:DHA2 family multidrug resistance protein